MYIYVYTHSSHSTHNTNKYIYTRYWVPTVQPMPFQFQYNFFYRISEWISVNFEKKRATNAHNKSVYDGEVNPYTTKELHRKKITIQFWYLSPTGYKYIHRFLLWAGGKDQYYTEHVAARLFRWPGRRAT